MEHLNPHQFGDQLTLFHAPLGQPEAGVFRGNPNARLYRRLNLPSDAFDFTDPEKGIRQVHESQRVERGHEIGLGIHWQHDIENAKRHTWGAGNRRVILEADHPGHEHVVDFTHDWRAGPMEDSRGQVISGSRAYPRAERSEWTQRQRDYHIAEATIGPHNMLGHVLPEVPIRPGAPLQVHAVHVEGRGGWMRHPVGFEGMA